MRWSNPELFVKKAPLLWGGAAALSLGGYLLASALTYSVGFPLDDAWIHQTYARNLGLRGEWAFLPGQPSAGSTAPLWSALLAVGYPLRLAPYIWTYFLGWLLLWGVAKEAVGVFQRLTNRDGIGWVGVGLFFVFEWHFAWMAASGMETLLLAWLAMKVAHGLATERRHYWSLAAWIGLSTWVRPDGLTLLAPVLWGIWWDESTWKQRWGAVGKLVVGGGVFVGLYLLFNYWIGGQVWPNTFFAKQAEYAVLREIPLSRRWLAQLSLPLVGGGALLLPGFLAYIGLTVKERRWSRIGIPLWVLGYALLYALRLPVTYQHGRYMMPAMGLYFVWGLAGSALLWEGGAETFLRRVVRRSWALALVVVTLVFYGLGARVHGIDVAFIESEMVTTARWVRDNTPPHAVVAAHDIGALGFFGERFLVDMAGLVTPEVIPFIRDEERLVAYLDARQVDYLVTFPDWYPKLVSGKLPIYVTGSTITKALGKENMAVYPWREGAP